MDKINGTDLPLTQSQTLLWTGQKLNPDVPLYNVPYSFVIFGEIDEAIFRIAFQELVKRADVLRITFHDIEDVPYQNILPPFQHDLEIIHLDPNTGQTEIDQWLAVRSQKIFELSQPLFDSALLRLDAEKYLWFLNLHHLVTDATSSTILFSMMSDLYGKISKNQLDSMEKTPAFADFIAHESRLRLTESVSLSQSYWKEKAKQFLETPKLYGNKKKIVGTAAKRFSTVLGQTQTNKLKELASRPEMRSWTLDLSIFNIISSLLLIHLYRVSGQKKLAIGSPVHNRTSKEFKNTAGLFIEIFPLTAELEDDDTFYSVFQRVKLESNEFLRYAETGASSAEISRSFNAVFNYIHTNFPEFDGNPTKTRWIHPEHCDPSHHLRCHLYDMDKTGEMELVFDLNTDVFNKDTIEAFPHHFLNLLDAALEDMEQPILKPSLLTDTKMDALLPEPNSLEIIDPSVLIRFESTVEAVPDSVALQLGNQSMTFDELNKRANKLANYLGQKGIVEGNRVALYFSRSPEYVISLLAVMKLGATFIPLASDQPASRIEFILTNSDCSLALTESRLKGNIKNTDVPLIVVTDEIEPILEQSDANIGIRIDKTKIAYILYTSGSTGNPKGVLISHGALSNYLSWAATAYEINEESVFPLFTSIGFDLTISATFLPLLNRGKLVIYKEAEIGPDIALFQVIGANMVNVIKLTPSHLHFLKGRDMSKSLIKTMIVGGEDFKSELANSMSKAFGEDINIFNEYGPTEATVGCIVSKYDAKVHTDASVPIGSPISHVQAYVLDPYKNQVPKGVVGELYIGGAGLAEGYVKLPGLTAEKFIINPFDLSTKIYHTGDLARLNEANEFEYLGRVDEQIKLRGFRIELADIESNLAVHDAVDNCAVVVLENEKAIPDEEVENCVACGLPSNYPAADIDENGVCHLCNAFKGYKDQAQRYFKTENELRSILVSQRGKNPNYDCISLLSGGKDSTYILAQLIQMGLKVLAFTLDNGYISDQAKGNIDRIVKKLNVDHVYGKTEHMNKIFVDSLQRHQNVCNGCFKTIYTISTQIALEKKIPFIVTGLSRGQFFETRLTEELFWDENAEVDKIDNTILEARKLYHQEEDAVKSLLDVSAFEKNSTFDQVQFIDFYRYSDVSLEEMLKFLEEKVEWVRPTDTGRSTNCLINQVGIYVHKKKKGYSNYSFPYSWDVRLGHKTRAETLEEINEVIDEKEVKRIMAEIGYFEPVDSDVNQERLVAYYAGKQQVSNKELKEHLQKKLPSYMVPTHFKYMKELPLTTNGKIDKLALKALNISQLEMDTPFVAPQGEIEELLATIWKEVLRLKKVGVHDNFIALGGHSLAAIRVTARINEEVEAKFPLNKIFELPTISEYANYIEETLMSLMDQ